MAVRGQSHSTSGTIIYRQPEGKGKPHPVELKAAKKPEIPRNRLPHRKPRKPKASK